LTFSGSAGQLHYFRSWLRLGFSVDRAFNQAKEAILQQLLKMNLHFPLYQLAHGLRARWLIADFLRLNPNAAGGWTLLLAEDRRYRYT
jgi:hypothetical protein